MKLKTMIAAVFAAAAIFSSCSKENSDIDTGNGDSKAVKIQVQYATQARATGEEVKDGDAITLGLGYIFFTNDAGNIYTQYEIVPDAATAGENQVGLTAISTGATLTNIDGRSTKCYILSKAGVALPAANMVTAGKTIADVEALVLTATGFADDKGGVSKVPVWGVGNIKPTNEVTVDLYALATRIQVKSFVAEQSKVTNSEGVDVVTAITKYSIKGIFVNNYYPNIKVGGAYDGAIVDNGSTVANYLTTSNAYKTGAAGEKLYDWKDAGLGVYTSANQTTIADKNEYSPELTSPVWAYNLIPTPADTKDAVPHIVILFGEIEYTVDGVAQPKLENHFITVKGIVEGGNAIKSLTKGHVYTFNAIKFSMNKVTNVPEVDVIDCDVDINIFPWKGHTVDPEM